MPKDWVKKEIKRYIMVFCGAVIFSAGMNMFIVPLDLYSSGALGIAQILRTFLNSTGKVPAGFDIAGILNFLLNLPLLILAFRTISKNFFFKTILSVVTQTVCMSLIRIPPAPLIDDVLGSCIIGGVICGAAMGITLMASGSGGGVDILGVYFTKRFDGFSVGKLGIILNVILYTVCAVLFDLETALYSIIFTVCMNLVVDKTHSQNINVTCMIFSKGKGVAKAIMKQMGRGVTAWEGVGAYTGESTEIITVVINKYEVAEIKHIIKEIDPHAFVLFFEGTHVSGNFEKRL